jgi:hypothetical protein
MRGWGYDQPRGDFTNTDADAAETSTQAAVQVQKPHVEAGGGTDTDESIGEG